MGDAATPLRTLAASPWTGYTIRTMVHHETPYRPDIDGLRAISILLVVAYHAQPWLVPGGFIGVDVFFVISGFLITKIILTRIDAGSFSFGDFYARRIRRIFPALIVVLTATYLVGWFALLPDQFVLLGENIAAGVAFAANLFQLGQTGYFAPAAADNPLLHLWSLGVEEQFYIFWPPAILLLSVTAKRGGWIAIIALLSFAFSLSIFFGYETFAFYSPLTRAWELLAGGLLAHQALARKGDSWDKPFGEYLALFGLIAILGPALLLDRTSAFPGLYALLPVLGAVLLIATPNSAVNKMLLSTRPMVWIGLISYPLYLWHWPVLSYLGILRNGVPNVMEIWAAVAVSVILSWLTLRFVEIPLRDYHEAVKRLALGLALVGVAGIATIAAAGFDFRYPAEVQAIARIQAKDNAGFGDKCFLEAPGAEFNAGCIEQGAQPLVFLWGDSTAAALYPGLKEAEAARGSFRLARFSAAGCAPILDSGANARCDEVHRLAFGFLQSAQPDVVLLHAMWGTNNDLGKLRETIARLRASKVGRIVILGPLPVWKRTLPHTLVNHYRFWHEIPERIAVGVSGIDNDQRMEAFSKAEGVEYISAWHTLCSAAGCLTGLGTDPNQVLITDTVHLSDAGSKYLIRAIGRELLPSPLRP
ncbi:acyltransferase family protein [Bradyrhizobium sp. BRP22]|uniref:acyltransferase family protein n=1 Tax=Bradyrhizobium sp. BRP22 TaxID=2793821 RepID=UPI001CD2494D|nr:acyltransferase family protein [Bradyrhizobium sp. BRP22]MCA1457164.1 acyltransferase family protein [Bradyrhizobium sp. BRP22]